MVGQRTRVEDDLGSSRAAELLESLAGRGTDRVTRGDRGPGRLSSVLGRLGHGPVPESFHDDGTVDRSTSTERMSIVFDRVRRIVPPVLLIVVVSIVVGSRFLAAPPPIEHGMRTISSDDVTGVDAVLDASAAVEAPQSSSGSAQGGGSLRAAVAGSDGSGDVGSITVHVAGAVVRPGVVVVPEGSRVNDAVVAAGGFTTEADPDRLNLAAVLADGWRVRVPLRGEQLVDDVVVPVGDGGAGPDPSQGGGDRSTNGGGTDGLIDINTATAAELEALPGVGPATAGAIVAKRDSDGPFRSVESLLDVRGIGPVKLEGLRDLVTVG